MINIMISIPVHEKTEVVIDQIVNYKHFCPGCGIVLHISKSFNYKDSFHTEKEFMFILSTFENVFVNPNHLDTAFADIVHTHVSNFEYISKVVDFEYFSLNASNELFVRHMPKIKDIEANFVKVAWPNHDSWNKYWRMPLINDKYLNDILDYFKQDRSEVKVSQIEGSYYKNQLFASIIEVINKFYKYEEVSKLERTIYPREEVYYPTIAHFLNKDMKMIHNNYTFVPWATPGYLPSMEEINDIVNGDKDGKYSIKRVLREFNDPVRVMIGTQIGNYRNKSLECVKIRFGKMSRKFFNLVSGRRRIFVGHENDIALVKTIFELKDTDKYLPFKIIDKSLIVDDILTEMKNNRDALFIIITKIYPKLANIFTINGFKENVDFIDGSLLMDS